MDRAPVFGTGFVEVRALSGARVEMLIVKN